MKIYISIPISGHDIDKQRAIANEIADKIRELGHEPVNPFDTPEAPPEMSEKEKYAYYMGEDVKRLMLCDAVFLCYGWAYSRGCRIEEQISYIMGLGEFYNIEDIPQKGSRE